MRLRLLAASTVVALVGLHAAAMAQNNCGGGAASSPACAKRDCGCGLFCHCGRHERPGAPPRGVVVQSMPVLYPQLAWPTASPLAPQAPRSSLADLLQGLSEQDREQLRAGLRAAERPACAPAAPAPSCAPPAAAPNRNAAAAPNPLPGASSDAERLDDIRRALQRLEGEMDRQAEILVDVLQKHPDLLKKHQAKAQEP